MLKNGICDDCGRYSETIHKHHKNRVHSDNSLENVKYLCPKCHGLEHGYESAEKDVGIRFGDALDAIADRRINERLKYGFELLNNES